MRIPTGMMPKLSSLFPVVAFSAALLVVILINDNVVVDAQTLFNAPNWIIPSNLQPYQTMAVNVGDSMTFSWTTGTHNVWIYPSGNCQDERGKYEIGSITDNPVTYTFTETDAEMGTVTFVCDIGSHCEAGQIMDVIVLGGSGSSVGGGGGNVIGNTLEPTDGTIDTTPPTVVPGTTTADDESAVGEGPEGGGGGGSFETCYICGNDVDMITNPDVIVQLPGGINSPPNTFFPVACSDLYTDGLNGDIPDVSCTTISQLSIVPCGCVPPNFTCNVCGEPQRITEDGDPIELEIKSPNNVVTIPTQTQSISPDGGVPSVVSRSEQVRCDELAESGKNGTLTPSECTAATLFAFTGCGCAPKNFTCNVCGSNMLKVQNPDVPIQIPSFGGGGSPLSGTGSSTTTCGILEGQGSNGELSPQECVAAEALVRTAGCGCGPAVDVIQDIVDEQVVGQFDTCNICENVAGFNNSTLEPVTKDVPLVLSATDNRGTCGDLYELGMAGGLGPTRCTAAQTQAELFCNCAPQNYTCNVCGTDAVTNTLQQMINPEIDFSDPNGYVVNCGQADQAGKNGVITPNDCDVITPLAQVYCGCAPVGYTCNICGESDMNSSNNNNSNALLSVRNVNETFVPGETITCGEAESLGRNGQFDPTTCTVYSSLARLPDSCGCAPPQTTLIPPGGGGGNAVITGPGGKEENESEDDPVGIIVPSPFVPGGVSETTDPPVAAGITVSTTLPATTPAVDEPVVVAAPSGNFSGSNNSSMTNTTISDPSAAVPTSMTESTLAPVATPVAPVQINNNADDNGDNTTTTIDGNEGSGGAITFDPTAAPVTPQGIAVGVEEGVENADDASSASRAVTTFILRMTPTSAAAVAMILLLS